MSHMVIYRDSEGKPGYHQTDDIHDAVAFVEQLRNDDGVEHARIFRLEEVAFEYRPYFRVELKAGSALGAGAPAPAAVAAPAPDPVLAASPPPSVAPAAAPAVSAPAPTTPAAVPSIAEPQTTDTSTSDASSSAPAADPSAAPAPGVSSPPAEGGDNGVGARRGLFGR